MKKNEIKNIFETHCFRVRSGSSPSAHDLCTQKHSSGDFGRHLQSKLKLIFISILSNGEGKKSQLWLPIFMVNFGCIMPSPRQHYLQSADLEIVENKDAEQIFSMRSNAVVQTLVSW